MSTSTGPLTAQRKKSLIKRASFIAKMTNIGKRRASRLYGEEGEIDEEMDDASEKSREQIKLTDAQLNEVLPVKMLLPNNPQASMNTTTFNYQKRKFETLELVDHLVIHFAYESNLMMKESAEAKVQEDILEIRKNMIQDAIRNQEAEDKNSSSQQDLEAIKKTLRNKFNYNERGCQTINEGIRERGVSTEPPKAENFSEEITQWQIFDAYVEHYLANLAAGDKEGKEEIEVKQENSHYSTSFKKCVKIMERMIVNSEEQKRYEEYKYFLNPEEGKDPLKGEPILFPIWRLSGEKQRRKNVTGICWNPKYKDLFAASYGHYEFMRNIPQKPGLICIYSLKNINHPEITLTTESGVMCLAFHPNSPALLAAGLYDGTVLVYDIRSKQKKPIYHSSVKTGKHSDPVWQVYWNPDINKKKNFFSISSDGKVMNWILMKNKLEAEEVIRLKLVGSNPEEDSALIGLACGLCFDFNPFEGHLFLVGTEEGKIHKCSTSYSGQYLETFKGHLMAVYRVKWNPFHKNVFISSSADWTVKIWEINGTSPIMNFELGFAVVDVQWSPYCSTAFAAASLERVSIYDLEQNKHQKLTDRKPVKQPKLTNLSFNQWEPILLVGDSHGGVTLVKMSPNLTIGIEREQVKGSTISYEEYQKDKLDGIITLVGKFERDEV